MSAIDAARSFRSAGLTIALDGSQDGELSAALIPYWEKEGIPRWREGYLSRRRGRETIAQLLSGLETRQYNDDDPPEEECFSGDEEEDALLSSV